MSLDGNFQTFTKQVVHPVVNKNQLFQCSQQYAVSMHSSISLAHDSWVVIIWKLVCKYCVHFLINFYYRGRLRSRIIRSLQIKVSIYSTAQVSLRSKLGHILHILYICVLKSIKPNGSVWINSYSVQGTTVQIHSLVNGCVVCKTFYHNHWSFPH